MSKFDKVITFGGKVLFVFNFFLLAGILGGIEQNSMPIFDGIFCSLFAIVAMGVGLYISCFEDEDYEEDDETDDTYNNVA